MNRRALLLKLSQRSCTRNIIKCKSRLLFIRIAHPFYLFRSTQTVLYRVYTEGESIRIQYWHFSRQPQKPWWPYSISDECGNFSTLIPTALPFSHSGKPWQLWAPCPYTHTHICTSAHLHHNLHSQFLTVRFELKPQRVGTLHYNIVSHKTNSTRCKYKCCLSFVFRFNKIILFFSKNISTVFIPTNMIILSETISKVPIWSSQE